MIILFLDINTDEEFQDTPEKPSPKEETKMGEPEKEEAIVDEKEEAIVDEKYEAVVPDQFKIGDDRIEYKINSEDSDKFSITDVGVSQAESSQVEGLWENAQKFEGDQNFNLPESSPAKEVSGY